MTTPKFSPCPEAINAYYRLQMLQAISSGLHFEMSHAPSDRKSVVLALIDHAIYNTEYELSKLRPAQIDDIDYKALCQIVTERLMEDPTAEPDQLKLSVLDELAVLNMEAEDFVVNCAIKQVCLHRRCSGKEKKEANSIEEVIRQTVMAQIRSTSNSVARLRELHAQQLQLEQTSNRIK